MYICIIQKMGVKNKFLFKQLFILISQNISVIADYSAIINCYFEFFLKLNQSLYCKFGLTVLIFMGFSLQKFMCYITILVKAINIPPCFFK